MLWHDTCSTLSPSVPGGMVSKLAGKCVIFVWYRGLSGQSLKCKTLSEE